MRNKILFILAFLFAFSLILLFSLHYPFVDRAPKLQVVFFDVGQGDSALITTPGGQTILVDGGEGEKVLAKLGRFLPFYQKKIDIMILSHPHADHLDGLVAVLEKYQVGQIYYSGVPHTTSAFFEWLKLIKEKNIPMRIVSGRRTIKLDSGVELKFLYPARDLSGLSVEPQEETESQKENSLNNTSVVFKLIYGETGFLFMGDAETPVEESLLSPPYEELAPSSSRGGGRGWLSPPYEGGGRGWLQSTVLKIAHHGSHSSTSEDFLRAVQPRIAVISVGRDNDFGHPHARTLRRLERLGVSIYRTDEKGDVMVESDGKRVRVY